MKWFFSATVLAAVVFSGVLAAADLSGRWSGSIEVVHDGAAAPIRTPVELRLKQTGDSLSGTIGRDGHEEQARLQNGRVEGNRVSFEASSSETSGPVRFELTLEGDRLTGDMSGAVAQGNISGRVTLARAHE